MRKLLLASIAATAIGAGSSAQAADLVLKAPRPVTAPVPYFSWTGCYVGAHGGVGWSQKSIADGDASRFFIDTLASTRGATLDMTGGIVGGQLGCDYEFAGNWVIGFSGSFAGAHINGTAVDPFNSVGILTLNARADWLITVEGRFGYAWDRWLFYVTGGAAWVGDQFSFFGSAGHGLADCCGESFEASAIRSGGTLGVGLEVAFAPNWSAFIQYDHYFLGHQDLVMVGNLDSPEFVTITQDIDAVKAGISYRVNGGSAPVVARY